MLELSNILNNMTQKSLVILDEIGRGTSTVDGCSIAQAVLEYLHGRSPAGPKTLFATHFHELIDLEGELKRVKNYHFAVQETKRDVCFLRKLIPGATDRELWYPRGPACRHPRESDRSCLYAPCRIAQPGGCPGCKAPALHPDS